MGIAIGSITRNVKDKSYTVNLVPNKDIEEEHNYFSQIEDIIMCEDDQSFLGGEYTIRISM